MSTYIDRLHIIAAKAQDEAWSKLTSLLGNSSQKGPAHSALSVAINTVLDEGVQLAKQLERALPWKSEAETYRGEFIAVSAR